jgi:hypothetical protein
MFYPVLVLSTNKNLATLLDMRQLFFFSPLNVLLRLLQFKTCKQGDQIGRIFDI